MAVFRTFDPSLLNRLANIPAINATVGAHLVGQKLDYTECADRPDDYVILTNGSDAVSLFEYRGPCVLDGHSIFGETCRGRAAIAVGREMIDWLFLRTSALIITGSTPMEFRAARFFNRKIGMSSAGSRMLYGAHWTHEMEHFQLLRTDWAARQS